MDSSVRNEIASPPQIEAASSSSRVGLRARAFRISALRQASTHTPCV